MSIKDLISGSKSQFIEKVKAELASKALEKVSSMNEAYVDAPDNDTPRMTPAEQARLIKKTDRHPAYGTNNDEVEAHDEMGKLRASDSMEIDDVEDDEDDEPLDSVNEGVEDFLRAASEAKKDGKTKFKFGGKEYPVTISRDDAKKIIKPDKEDGDGGADDYKDEELDEAAIEAGKDLQSDLEDAVKKREDVEFELGDGEVVELEWKNIKTLLKKTTVARIQRASKSAESFLEFLDDLGL